MTATNRIGIVVAAFFAGGALVAAVAGDMTTPSKAVARMIKVCGQEFPAKINGKSVSEVDEWAEAQASAGNAAYRRSRCAKAHDQWVKIAKQGDWSTGSPARMPASETSESSGTSQ